MSARKLILFVSLVFVTGIGRTQDTILLKANDTIIGYDVQVNEEFIEFYILSQPNQLKRTIRTLLADSVFYADGRRYSIKEGRFKEQESVEYFDVAEKKALPRKNNQITLDAGALVLKDIELRYKRMFAHGFIGVQIPLVVGFERNNFNNNVLNKIIGSGIDVHFYINPTQKVRYFFGPCFEYTQYQVPAWQASGPPILVYKPYTAFVLSQGLEFNFLDQQVIQIGVGFGARRFSTDSEINHMYWRGMISYGFNF